MTEKQFIDAVMEEIFIRGFICPPVPVISNMVQGDWQRIEESPDPTRFAERCVQFLGLTNRATNPIMGIPSTTAGAREDWLAVHEAGHALTGVKAGITLWGVRFYNDGLTGEALFEDSEWCNSEDEALLRAQIRIDVAANLAQMICEASEPAGGYPSRFFDHQKPEVGGQYPTDIIGAWKRALRLATIRFEREGRPLDPDELWETRRELVQQAEAEARHVLLENLDALKKLAEALRRGPMTGAAVRAIVEA